MKIYELDVNGKTASFPHYWEMCVGSCHAATALRADWQQQLERCHKELGFRYVRFHGLFNDDMSVVTRPMLASSPVYCFTNIDRIYDFLLSIGMKPFVEIGFMPECMASGNKTIFHYKGNTTPPKSYEEWTEFIGLFLEHLIGRYGRAEVRSWYFEIWNEPNLGGADSPFGFWSADKEEYWKLYDVTCAAIKRADPALRVGGPATSNNAWLTEFLAHCQQSGAPVDFVSTHHYPTDVVVGYGVEDSQNFSNPLDMNDPEKMKSLIAAVKSNPEQVEELKKEYSVFQSHLWEHVERGVLTDMAKRARSEVGALPLFYTEWGSLAGLPSDGAFGASFIAKTLLDNQGIVDGYSFWAFTDISEESAQSAEAFHGGFGLLTQHGIPKAPYRAFQLMHGIRGKRYEQTLAEGTVDVSAFWDEELHVLQLLAVNHQSLLHPVERETVRVTLKNAPVCVAAESTCIDETHANALCAWKKMGEPVYLTSAQRLALESASCLETVSQPFLQESGTLSFDIVLEPMGMAMVTLYFEK